MSEMTLKELEDSFEEYMEHEEFRSFMMIMGWLEDIKHEIRPMWVTTKGTVVGSVS
jgi:hypothetical protein